MTLLLLSWCLIGPSISQFVSSHWSINLLLSGPGGMLAFIVRMIAMLIASRRIAKLKAMTSARK